MSEVLLEEGQNIGNMDEQTADAAKPYVQQTVVFNKSFGHVLEPDPASQQAANKIISQIGDEPEPTKKKRKKAKAPMDPSKFNPAELMIPEDAVMTDVSEQSSDEPSSEGEF